MKTLASCTHPYLRSDHIVEGQTAPVKKRLDLGDVGRVDHVVTRVLEIALFVHEQGRDALEHLFLRQEPVHFDAFVNVDHHCLHTGLGFKASKPPVHGGGNLFARSAPVGTELEDDDARVGGQQFLEGLHGGDVVACRWHACIVPRHLFMSFSVRQTFYRLKGNGGKGHACA